MPFSDVGYWWQGRVASVDLWCHHTLACVAPVEMTRVHRGLPESIVPLRSDYPIDFQWHQADRKCQSGTPGYPQIFHIKNAEGLTSVSKLNPKNTYLFFFCEHPLKLSSFLPWEAETLICQWCLNVRLWILVRLNKYPMKFSWQIGQICLHGNFHPCR